MSKFEALAEKELRRQQAAKSASIGQAEDPDSSSDEDELGAPDDQIAKRAAVQLDERAFEDDRRQAVVISPEQVAAEQAELLVDVPDTTEDLVLTHSRIRSLAGLKLQRFAEHCTSLCLRQNLLSSLMLDEEAPIESLIHLRELDCYDNKLTSINGIKGLSDLQSLDFSFNLIKTIPHAIMSTLTSLTKLYLIQNKIAHVDGLDGLAATLTSLELGGNRLRNIENLDKLVHLTELWLGKNKITKFEHLESLVNLRVLSISSNRITRIENLDALQQLEELYMSHNGLTDLTGLENLTRIRVLDVCANRINTLTSIAHLHDLEEFWANDNQLTSLQEVEDQLKGCQALETVYFEGNPLQASAGPMYRRKIMTLLPQVKQIDATCARLPHKSR